MERVGACSWSSKMSYYLSNEEIKRTVSSLPFQLAVPDLTVWAKKKVFNTNTVIAESLLSMVDLYLVPGKSY